MKNTIINKMRRVSVIFALCGMTFGIFFPAISTRRVSAEGKTPLLSEIIKPTVEQVEQQLGKTPVEFEENRGQFDKNVRFMARAAGSTIFLTADEIVYVLPMESSPKSKVQSPKLKDFRANDQDKTPRLAFALRMKLVGANADSTFAGEETVEHRTNYFKGSDAANWQTDVPNHSRVRYENVYDGVGMVWHGRENSETQYDFVVAPNADAGQISLEFDGADSLEIDADGNLLIHTPAGIVKQNKPFSYQETDGVKQEIESGFILSEPSAVADGSNRQTVKFALGSYDRTKPLTIDPTVNLSRLAYSTLLGGAGSETGRSIAVDSSGNAYITGQTLSPEYPTTSGTYDTTHNESTDVFVSKLNAAGSGLIYSTFIGGNNSDGGTSIAIDAAGNAYLTGVTGTDYPTTAGAFDTTSNGGNDVFLTKLNAAGSGLIYSTYIGGSGNDVSTGITIDSTGNAYLTGYTDDTGSPITDYPTTGGAFDTTHNGDIDVFATKLNAGGSALIYSTYIGGSGVDLGNDIAIDAAGNAYLTGETPDAATDFPTTGGAFDTTHNGDTDVFVTKLNAGGTALIYSTFIGGSGFDQVTGIAIDATNNAYLTGGTFDAPTDYPTTAGAFDTTHDGFEDVFVTKLNAGGSALIYSTFIGGNLFDHGNGIAIDSSGNAYLTGYTSNSDTIYPTTAGAYDTTHNGSDDVFVTKLNATGSALVYSTFIGGSGTDSGLGIATDSAGNVYLVGDTNDDLTDYPTTGGAFDTTHNGFEDVFVTKLSGQKPVYDFDGDGKTDLSIFRPAPGEWWYLRSSTGGNAAFTFGSATDKIVQGDYTGDGKTDIAFWRPSTGFWFILRSEDNSFFSFPLGLTGDIPAPADYDGDGKTDAAVFRPSSLTWFISKSTGGTTITTFGATGDKPVVADYDGDCKADIAIFRPSLGQWWIQRSSNLSVFALQFGVSTDKPVQGDYTGDGKADTAFWRPSNGTWFVLRSEDLSFFSFPFGTGTDIPAPGDYDGDGRYDAAVFRPSDLNWYVQRSTAGTLIQRFGIAGDQPVPNAFVP